MLSARGTVPWAFHLKARLVCICLLVCAHRSWLCTEHPLQWSGRGPGCGGCSPRGGPTPSPGCTGSAARGWGPAPGLLPAASAVERAQAGADQWINAGELPLALPSPAEGGESNQAMGTALWLLRSTRQPGPLGIHEKSKCNKFSGLSESDYYLV